MLGLKGEIDTDTRNRSEHVAAPYERQRLPLPLRKPRFLQQFLDQSPWPVDRELDALAAEARANHHRRPGDLRQGEPVTFRTLEYKHPAGQLDFRCAFPRERKRRGSGCMHDNAPAMATDLGAVVRDTCARV